MENYDDYKRARDLTWKAIIDCGINELPIDLRKIADFYGIKVISYKRAVSAGLISPEMAKGRFFVKVIDNRKTIFVNQALKDKGSIRFSIANGIGVCLLSEIPWITESGLNYMSGVFARDLLMPATVLFSIGALETKEIEKICFVSGKAAEIRARRMAELVNRKRFNTHPLERKVTEQFKDYIEKYKRREN